MHGEQRAEEEEEEEREEEEEQEVQSREDIINSLIRRNGLWRPQLPYIWQPPIPSTSIKITSLWSLLSHHVVIGHLHHAAEAKDARSPVGRGEEEEEAPG